MTSRGRLMVDMITKPSTSSIKDSQQDQCSNDKDLFLCVDELFEDEPGSIYQTNQDNLTCLEIGNNLRSSPLNPEQAATAEIVENVKYKNRNRKIENRRHK
ncbi:uncharacterized protein LOC124361547 [Homalodisca vitripennis]|uniref:uncharacterized protein LOC124361547 n=1 Tax=Homalodisca vitripennis TaxID=197043 RepID=UPI001EEA39E0|nr:uncharacterized protein LOC124361547 [Homalodisca vitripennis]